MKTEIKSINNEIYRWYQSLEDKSEYAKPYLVTPEDEYCIAEHRGLILGKETGGWLENVENPDIGQVENEYQRIIHKSVSMNGSAFWRMYFDLKDSLVESIKVTAGNVALLGYHYGTKGFPLKYADKLAFFLKKYIEILKPECLIIFCGAGTISRSDIPYIRILEMIFGEYQGSEALKGNSHIEWPLRYLRFEKSGTIRIFGTRHPERAPREWKESILITITETINGLLK